MFVAILDWLLKNVPSFLRPGVRWLVDGLGRITNYISSRWNALGIKVSKWVWAVAYLKDRALNFGRAVLEAMVWIKTVWIPRKIGETAQHLKRLLDESSVHLNNLIAIGISSLQQWVRGVIDGFTAAITSVIAFVQHWIDRIIITTNDLIRLLGHVLNGPVALAEWLVAAMWQAFTRYAYAQRDRIAQWLIRESAVFTRWAATEVENIILRWL